MSYDHRSYERKLSNCVKKPEKVRTSTGFFRTHKWPAPNVSGFIAQLVRASHRYREVTGSNPVEVLTSGFYTQLLKLRSYRNCDDHSPLEKAILLILIIVPFILFESFWLLYMLESEII